MADEEKSWTDFQDLLQPPQAQCDATTQSWTLERPISKWGMIDSNSAEGAEATELSPCTEDDQLDTDSSEDAEIAELGPGTEGDQLDRDSYMTMSPDPSLADYYMEHNSLPVNIRPQENSTPSYINGTRLQQNSAPARFNIVYPQQNSASADMGGICLQQHSPPHAYCNIRTIHLQRSPSPVNIGDIYYGPIKEEIAEELCKRRGEYLLRTASGSSRNFVMITARKMRRQKEWVHLTIYEEKHPSLPSQRIYFLDERTKQLMFTNLPSLLHYLISEGFEETLFIHPCNKEKLKVVDSVSKGHIVNPNAISSKTYFTGQYKSESVVLVQKESWLSVLKEGRLRQNFDHPNIVPMIGLRVLDPLCLVLPDEARYSLLDHIKKLKSSKTDQMMNICHDVCCGMIYLHSLDCLHRSLRSQSCIMDRDGTVKISDFDKSSAEENETDCSEQLFVPTRWSAPEVLWCSAFSKASDVWSFGVLVWEVFNKGQIPYSDLQNDQLKEKLNPGFRLTLNKKHAKYDEILEKCLRYNSRNRPSFYSLGNLLHSLL